MSDSAADASSPRTAEPLREHWMEVSGYPTGLLCHCRDWEWEGFGDPGSVLLTDPLVQQSWFLHVAEAASLNTYASSHESQSDSSPGVVEALRDLVSQHRRLWPDARLALTWSRNHHFDAWQRAADALAALPAQREPARAADAENDYWESRIWTDHADAGADR